MSDLASLARVETKPITAIPVAKPGASTPSVFKSINFDNLLESSLSKTVGNAASGLFGDSKIGQLVGNAVGNVGALVGTTIAHSLISNQNIAQNLKNINFSLQGYGLAGGLLGTAIGGDTGQAVGTAISGIPLVVNSIKGIKATKNTLDAGKVLTTAGKWSLAGNIANLAGLGSTIAGSFIKPKSEYSGLEGKTTLGLDTAYSAILAGVNFIPGIGLAISGGMAVADFLGKGLNAIGAGTDGMTTQDAILGSSFFNWTPLGIVNGAFGKKAETFDKDTESWNLVNGAYEGSEDMADYAAQRSGKKYGLISNRARKKANRVVRSANAQLAIILDIANEDKVRDLILQTMSPYLLFNTYNLLNGGTNYYSQVAKEGGKLEKEDNWSPESWEEWTPESWEDIPEFKEGGKMNVIPEGSLHARLHHMNLEGITKKGIPVITEENGKIIQHAEIELNEIIFTLEVTKKIEELMKDGSAKAAIEAGKLLATEIIDNTDDRTGLLLEVE